MQVKHKQRKIQDIIRKAVDFHGHFGPFLIIGIRMSLIALKKFNSADSSTLRIVVETGIKPPVSCMIDGIQVATGCTFGKGRIEVVNKKKPKVVFLKQNESLEIELKKDVFQKIFEWLKIERLEKTSERILKLDDDELFIIK